MGSLGPTELIIVLVIFVLLFGAKKLPELGGSIGKGIKNFKRGIDDASDEDDGSDVAADDDSVSSDTT